MSVLSVFVQGNPAPAGSKTAFAFKRKNGKLGAAVTDASKRAKPWKYAVAARVAEEWDAAPLDCALAVDLHFTMPRLKSHFRTGKHAALLRDDAPDWHTVKPDVDKLIRPCFDALKGLVWKDDTVIAQVYSTKRYGEKPGVQIVVRRA